MTRWHLPPPEVLIEQMTDDLSNSAPGLGGFMKENTAGLDLDLDVGGWCKVLLKTVVEHVSVRVIDQTRRRSSAHGGSIISTWQLGNLRQ
jgi:hypothetical protein